MSEKAILDGLPMTSLKGDEEDYCPRRKTTKLAGLDKDWKVCALKGGRKASSVGAIKGDVIPFPSQTPPESLPTSSQQAVLVTPGVTPISPMPPKKRGRPKLPKGVKSKCQRARRNGIWVPGECAVTPKMKHSCDSSTARWVDVVRFPKSKRPVIEQRCQCASSGNKNILSDNICRVKHGEKQAPRPVAREEARAAGLGRKAKRRK